MMALFIVLWLMNSSKPIQAAVGGYFRDPYGSAQKMGTQLEAAGDPGDAKTQDMDKVKADLMKAWAGCRTSITAETDRDDRDPRDCRSN